MKLCSTIIVLVFFSFSKLFGQVVDSSFKSIKTGTWLELSFKPINSKGETTPFISVEEMPEYPGGFDALCKFIQSKLDYPKSAIRDSIEGRVLTSFIVDLEGNVTDVRTFRGVRYDLDSACVATIRVMPKWKQNKSSNFEDIRFQFLLPIKFMLNNPKEIKKNIRQEKEKMLRKPNTVSIINKLVTVFAAIPMYIVKEMLSGILQHFGPGWTGKLNNGTNELSGGTCKNCAVLYLHRDFLLPKAQPLWPDAA
jgi:TonB family protein